MIRGPLLLFLAWGFALGALAGEKETPLPKDLPPYGPLKPFKTPEVKEEKLPNGMTLWLVSRLDFPKVAFTVAVRGGMASDPKDRPGLSELIMATIDQGTKTRSARKIAEELQAAGGDLSGSATADSLVLATEVLASTAENALTVLADILQNAAFPDSEVALAKRNVSDSLRAREADPSFLAGRALANAMFAKHPYSVVSPTQESIAKTTPQEIRREYALRFRPDQALLVAVGDFDPPRMRSTLERLLGQWTPPRRVGAPPLPEPPRSSPHTIYFIHRPGSVQTTFAIGAFGPTERDRDFPGARVANAIYGGMFGSRLTKNIRESKGYTYSPSAVLRTRREAGVFQTRADVRNEVTGPAFNEIQYELNRMATTAPDEEELIRAQRYLVGTRAIELQLQESVARELASLWVRVLPPQELGRQGEQIQKVTAREVEALGKKYFPVARQTVVAVGEEKVIKNQLAPFGLEIKPAH